MGPDFMQSWWFMGLMALLLVVLIGVLLYIRNKPQDDE